MTRVTVAASAGLEVEPDEAYHFWNDRLRYPRFIPDLRSVDVIDAVWSRWSLRGRAEPVEVETTDNVLHHYVAWRMHGHHGERVSLWVEPGARARTTLLRLEISWGPEPGAPCVAAQQQRAEAILERFRAHVRQELDERTATTSRNRSL